MQEKSNNTKRKNKKGNTMIKKNLKPIPKFKNEGEERKFWKTYDVVDFFDMSKPLKTLSSQTLNQQPTQTISLRPPKHLLEGIKEIANSKDAPYQSLMKVFLAERVKKEYRSA